MFITFEGIDGSGKTTQLRRLGSYLEGHGQSVILSREPGGTGLAEAIRHTLLHAEGHIEARAELLLFGAARAQHVQEIIRPALQRNQWVLCDRFGDSSVAYQGGALGLDPHFVRAMNRFATGDLQPEVTFLLDIDPTVAFGRRSEGGEDKIEARGLAFQEKVRAAYLEAAHLEPERFVVLDAALPPEAIEASILKRIEPLLQARDAATLAASP